MDAKARKNDLDLMYLAKKRQRLQDRPIPRHPVNFLNEFGFVLDPILAKQNRNQRMSLYLKPGGYYQQSGKCQREHLRRKD